MSGLAYTDVVPCLLREAPELAPTFEVHVRDNDEVLTHLFFGDVTRYVHAALDRGDTEPVRRILAVLERAIASPDQNARELVEASFLENLEPDTDHLWTLAALAGPKMKAALEPRRQSRLGAEEIKLGLCPAHFFSLTVGKSVSPSDFSFWRSFAHQSCHLAAGHDPGVYRHMAVEPQGRRNPATINLEVGENVLILF